MRWRDGNVMMLFRIAIFAIVLSVFGFADSASAFARPQAGGAGQSSINDTSLNVPTRNEVARVIFLRDYNTRVVVLGTTLLGLAAGTIGAFMLLRKRALMGDALSHATLPGIGLAFIVAVRMGGDGKSLPVLLTGAVITGVLGVLAVLAIRNFTRLKEDAALGIVLSVFFGAGVAILGVIQKMGTGSAAGLESFIYGKTASMLSSDAWLIAGAAVVVIVACILMFKEFTLLCFDPAYAISEGWPVFMLDLIMMALVVAVTVIGLQAVGLILIIALLITPAAAARFWTERLSHMIVASALIGALSGWIGAAASALQPNLPAGAIIVVTAAFLFVLSMFLGSKRGVLRRLVAHRYLARNIARQNLLRAIFEWSEAAGKDPRLEGPSREEILLERSWSPAQLKRVLDRAERDELVYEVADGTWRVTDVGLTDAARTVRNHRLWEAYLINYADIAPSHVDRDADTIEHVLGRDIVSKLEALIAEQQPGLVVPPSPHLVGVKTRMAP
ncbi:MAG: manganese/zinc/iron transport system permease protein [Phycisphaerales bacterium]|jgi:manganese/zinc/iron transport system permease protein|nr:manganese/zinc/iron transport system permease protein [Phycisphaerales bacterium]